MRFEVLGPVRIRTRRREIAIAANRQRALLAMLLLQANRTVPAERLVDALWAEDPPRDARSQLHGCVYRLRKQLAAGGASGRVIVTEPSGYRAHVDVKSVDLLEFRAQVTEARSAAKEGRGTAGPTARLRRHWLRALELYRELDVPERHDVEQHLARLPTPMD